MWTDNRLFLSIQLPVEDRQSKHPVSRISYSTKHKNKWCRYQSNGPVNKNVINFEDAESRQDNSIIDMINALHASPLSSLQPNE